MMTEPSLGAAQSPLLRIALVNASDDGGGAEKCVLSLHRSFRRLGHDCRLFVGTRRTDEPGVIEIPRFRSFPGLLRASHWAERTFGWQYLYHPWFRQLDRLIGSVDVLNIHTLWGGQYGYADVESLPRLTRRYPTVMTLHEWWMLTGHCACPAAGCERWKIGCGQCPDLSIAPAISVDGTRTNWTRKRRAIAKSSLTVVPVSKALERDVSQSPIFVGVPTTVIPNSIDAEAFRPGDACAARQILNLPSDRHIVLVVGQSVEGIPSPAAIECALDALRQSECDPFVVAVGRKSQQFIAAWGRAGMALPYQSSRAELARIYQAADAVLVASLFESFGRVPAEAQMCGRCVVGFATGGIPEIVEHQATGWLVPTGDVAALAAGIRFALASSDWRESAGSLGAQRAHARYAEPTIADSYVRLFQLISRNRGRITGGQTPVPHAI